MAITARISTGAGAVALAAALATAAPARADLITLTPSDDGSLFECAGCNPSPARTHLLVGGDFVGDLMFPMPSTATPIISVQLTVNPWALPLSGPTMTVYGKGSNTGVLSQNDVTGTTYLGLWTLPSLTYGQDASFDVTSFVSTLRTQYVDFTLYSTGLDVFSTSAANYGHPSGLVITTPSVAVHEPSSLALMAAGFAGLCAVRQRKSVSRAQVQYKRRAQW